MNKIYKIVVSVFLISMLITPSMAKDTKVDTKVLKDEISTTEQNIYISKWFNSSTEEIVLMDYRGTEVLSQTITTRFPTRISVKFSSEVNYHCNDWEFGCVGLGLEVWATIDGEIMDPGIVLFADGSIDYVGINSFTFVRGYLPPGKHNIKILARSDEAYSFFTYRTMVTTATDLKNFNG